MGVCNVIKTAWLYAMLFLFYKKGQDYCPALVPRQQDVQILPFPQPQPKMGGNGPAPYDQLFGNLSIPLVA